MARVKKRSDAREMKSRAHKKQKTTVALPHFQHPFVNDRHGVAVCPMTRKERRMYEISSEIRSKPRWYEKVYDETIVSKWKKELGVKEDGEEEEEDEDRYYDDDDGISAEMFEDLLTDLKIYAEMRDGLITISPVQAVYQADGIIPDDVKAALIRNVAVLENVPDCEKDWHPGSKNQVLDLVHPSLFCLVHDVSLKRSEEEDDLIKEVEKEGTSGSLRHMGQGEPVQFMTDLSSEVDEEEEYDPYGNPLDDIHKVAEDYSFSKSYQWLPSEFVVDGDGKTQIQTYINNLHPVEHKDLYGTLEKIFDKFVPMFNMSLGHSQRLEIDLSNRRLQVIVKLANIVLTPEQPQYGGGSWHVEGMYNERIIASGIYYYTSTNITESRLSFREAVYEPSEYEKDQYGYYFGSRLNQDRGSVITQEDRCIAFPNTMQHCVQPFELADPTKPGIRKILVFFLVDPNERVTSTLHVPPQQQSWYLPVLRQGFPTLPDEIISQIIDYMSCPMSLSDAKAYREELMDERRFFVKENSTVIFERPCSLCEH